MKGMHVKLRNIKLKGKILIKIPMREILEPKYVKFGAFVLNELIS